jgi:hypothetical protein
MRSFVSCFHRQVLLGCQMKKHKSNEARSSRKIYEKLIHVFVKYPEGKIKEHIKQLYYEWS